MLSAILSGGIIMLPIILCGVVATFIIIERCYYFYVTKKRDLKLMYDLTSQIDSRDFQSALDTCEKIQTPTAIAAKKAIECRDWEEQDMKDAVEAEMSAVVPRFEHLLTPLGTISNIATLLGLLGTVTGNIKAFNVLGSGTTGDPAALAGAIAEALVTTVAGLVVSIPSLIFYNYFASRVNRRIAEMESNITNLVIHILGRYKK